MKNRKMTKMLATTTTTTTTHEWCRWVVVDFLCVFPMVKTANKLTTLIAKDQTSWVQVDGNILDPHESAIQVQWLLLLLLFLFLCNLAALLLLCKIKHFLCIF
jgi:hypothetical protein